MNFSLQQPATPAATPPSVATDLPGVENPPVPTPGAGAAAVAACRC